jgi:hypothetical protein
MKARYAAAATAAAAAALAAPAGASAATLAVQGACFVTNAPVPVVGAGWQPGAVVSIGGGAFGSAQADAAGNIATQVQAPLVTSVAPKTITLNATIPNAPAFTAAVQFPVIRDVLLSNAPLSGRPRQQTTWHFAGFPGGVAIYGHYRVKGRTVKNYRFGKPTGPCGTLTVRARRVPVPSSRLRSGTWTLQLDQRRHYRGSGARRVIRFRIFRTLL